MKTNIKNHILICVLALLSLSLNGSAQNCESGTEINYGVLHDFSTTDTNNDYTSFNCSGVSANTGANDQLLKVIKNTTSDRLSISIFNNNGLDLFLLEDCDNSSPKCLQGRTVDNSKSSNWIIETETDQWSSGTYGVVVDALASEGASDYTLMATSGRLDCASAIPLTCNDLTITGNTSTGINNISAYKFEEEYAAGNGGKELLYYFDVDDIEWIIIQLTMEVGIDLDLFLLDSCDEFDCSAISINKEGTTENITQLLKPGRYYILVDGFINAEGSFDLRVDASCVTNQIDCNDAIPMQCGQAKFSESFNNENDNNSIYPCTPKNTVFAGREKVYSFSLKENSNLSINLTPTLSNANDFNAGIFLTDNCHLNSRCNFIEIDPVLGVSEDLILLAGSYFLIIEEGNIEEFDIHLNWDCIADQTSRFSVCDIGGAFVNNGLAIDGKITNTDFPVLQIPQNECVKENYKNGVADNYFLDSYIFYYDPNEIDFLGASLLNIQEEDEVYISVYSCDCDEVSPGKPCTSKCIAQGQNVSISNNILDEGFYYFIVSGKEEADYTLQLFPSGPCDDIATPFIWNTDENEGNFSNASQNKINYSCYTGEKEYSGQGVIYRLALKEDSNLKITLRAEEPMAVFLFGPNCGEECLNFAELKEGDDLARIDDLKLIKGLYYIVIDKEQVNGDEAFTLDIGGDRDLTAPQFFGGKNCPVIDTSLHKVSFLGLNNSTIQSQGIPYNSRIAFFHTINEQGWLQLAAEGFWRNQNLLMNLYQDAPNDDIQCGYLDDEAFQMKIQLPSNDFDYHSSLTIKGNYLNSGDGDSFKSDGVSIITDLEEISDAALTYLNININSICVPPAANTFDIELSSNVDWRIIKALNSPWFTTTIEEGTGSEKLTISIDENENEERTDSLFFVGNDGSLRQLTIVQKSKNPDILSIDEPEWANSIKLFPNPSSGQVNLLNNNNNTDINISVFNILGKEIPFRMIKKNQSYLLDLTERSSGIYFLKIEKDNQFISRKIIISSN